MADLPCFWPPDWVSDERNYALVDDHGNVGLLDYVSEGVYEPHLYFTDRGMEALNRAKEMITWVFQNTKAVRLNGQTPILQKGAWWLARKLQFQKLGTAQSEWGPMRLSCMTRERWEELIKMEHSLPSVLKDSSGKLVDVPRGCLSGFALMIPYSCEGSVNSNLKETGQVWEVKTGGDDIAL